MLRGVYAHAPTESSAANPHRPCAAAQTVTGIAPWRHLITDTFWQDLANIPTLSEAEVIPCPDGGRLYPSLIAAEFDGYRPLMIDLTLPAGPGPHPLVIYIHGGGWVIGSPKITNGTMLRFNPFERIVGAGYALARISYRLLNEEKFPAQLADVRACIGYLRSKSGQFGLDPERFAALGESAGGYLALMAGLSGGPPVGGDASPPANAVRAVVNWYGVTDLSTIALENVEDGGLAKRLFGETADASRLRSASPVAHISAKSPAVLTQHGTADRVVPFSQAQELHEAMKVAGGRHLLDPIEGADHCFWNAPDTGLMDRMLKFLDEEL